MDQQQFASTETAQQQTDNNNSNKNNNLKVGEQEEENLQPSTPQVEDEKEILAAYEATLNFVNTPTTPISKPFSLTTTSSSTPFDINLVCDRFLRSIEDRAAIHTTLYLQGFTELNKYVIFKYKNVFFNFLF